MSTNFKSPIYFNTDTFNILCGARSNQYSKPSYILIVVF